MLKPSLGHQLFMSSALFVVGILLAAVAAIPFIASKVSSDFTTGENLYFVMFGLVIAATGGAIFRQVKKEPM